MLRVLGLVNGMATIIKVPSVYTVKLPQGEWINLALVRRCQVELDPVPVVVLTWENGQTQVLRGEKAIALLEALEETTLIDKSAR